MTTYSAVVTTGIYCRPGCGAKPRAENVRTFELAAAAEAAGFRACLRCRPYRVAGLAGSDAPELVCRAVQLIIAGVLDAGNEAELGHRLGISSRHLRRLFSEHLGVTPDQLARSRRAHFARRLLDDSDLTIADIAFASGFGSLRQFNRTMREVFRTSPQDLRARRRRSDRLVADGGLAMRLPCEPPYDWDAVLAFLAARAVPGVESVADGSYRRTISLDGGAGVLEVHRGDRDHLLLVAHLPYWEGLIHVADRVGRLFGIDADIASAVAQLETDPVIGRLVAQRPGVRPPGTWGPFETAVHSVLAQDEGLERAGLQMGELVSRHGQAIPGLAHGLTHLFPSAGVVAEADDAPRGVQGLAAALVAGRVMLDGTVELPELVRSLTSVEGIGEAAAQQIALRLGERDAYPAADPSLLRALQDLGVTDPEPAERRWRPWRAVAAMHLMTRSPDERPVGVG
jgi:AraC family transcriptional regulator, regulatory protein of adaptative response / DNA-3-methyladenine glycosylase II